MIYLYIWLVGTIFFFFVNTITIAYLERGGQPIVAPKWVLFLATLFWPALILIVLLGSLYSFHRWMVSKINEEQKSFND